MPRNPTGDSPSIGANIRASVRRGKPRVPASRRREEGVGQGNRDSRPRLPLCGGLVFRKSRGAAERVKESIAKSIGSTLRLRVDREKSERAYAGRLEFLGCGFCIRDGKCRLRLRRKTGAKMRRRLKAVASRSNGMGHARRKTALKEYLRGRTEYYNLADMGGKAKGTGRWLRRRIRMRIWKAWKRPGTRARNPIKRGMPKQNAYERGNTSQGHWRVADSWIATRTLPDEALHRAGYAWTGCYCKASALPKG